MPHRTQSTGKHLGLQGAPSGHLPAFQPGHPQALRGSPPSPPGAGPQAISTPSPPQSPAESPFSLQSLAHSEGTRPQQGRGRQLHVVLKNQHQTDCFSNPRVRFGFTGLPQPVRVPRRWSCPPSHRGSHRSCPSRGAAGSRTRCSARGSSARLADTQTLRSPCADQVVGSGEPRGPSGCPHRTPRGQGRAGLASGTSNWRPFAQTAL